MIKLDEIFYDQMKLIELDQKLIKLDEHMIDCLRNLKWKDGVKVRKGIIIRQRRKKQGGEGR